MGDITLVWNPSTFSADVAFTAADILTGDDLQTSIIVSLFTEPGWWGNAYMPDDWGCRLYELRRAKRSNDTLLKARDYCRAALRWLVEDRIAKAVDVQTAFQGTTLAIGITVTRATGVTRFSFVWDEMT